MLVRGSAFPKPTQHCVDDAVATGSGEAKNVRGGDVDVAGQRLTEQCPGAEEPAADGGRGNPQRLSRLFNAHFFDFPHHEDGPERHRKLIDPSFQNPPYLAAKRC